MNMNKALNGTKQRPMRKQMICTCVKTLGEGDAASVATGVDGEDGAFGGGRRGDLASSRAGATVLFISSMEMRFRARPTARGRFVPPTKPPEPPRIEHSSTN